MTMIKISDEDGGEKQDERQSPPSPNPNPVDEWKKTKPAEKRDFSKFKKVDKRARKKKEKHGE